MMTAIVEDTQEYQEAVEQVMEQESAKLSLGNVTPEEAELSPCRFCMMKNKSAPMPPKKWTTPSLI